MLFQVVEKGTAKLARSDYYEIGGKTGTANKINPRTKHYDDHRQVVSFLGFISATDGPRLAGLVIVDEPRLAEHLNYGGRLAAPLFRRIAEKAMAYYEVPAQFAVNDKAPVKPIR
jgi:cell division protein FtsI/penicillin-binding protein 2